MHQIRVRLVAAGGITSMRIKMNVSHLFSLIDETVNRSKSKVVKENAYGINIGLDLLASYLKEIGDMAISIGDERLISILSDMGVLKEEERNEN